MQFSIVTSETEQGRAITNPSEEISLFAQELEATIAPFIQQLKNEPLSAAQIETRLNHTFQKASDSFFAALLVQASSEEQAQEL